MFFFGILNNCMNVISLSTYDIFLLPSENIFLLSKEALKFCATFVE